MRAIVQQLYVIIWTLSVATVVVVHGLEIGFVSSLGTSNIPHRSGPEPPPEPNQTTIIQGIGQHAKTHTHLWIPGQVRHHAYIPAHVHHIFLPDLLVRRSTGTTTHSDTLIRQFPAGTHNPYGGYGVGSHTGGQGAGHGFQIVFTALN